MSAPALDWNVYTNIIDGKPHTTTETRYSVNPATKEPLLPVPVSTRADLDLAVAAARKAFPTWAATPWEDRVKAVLAFREAVLERVDEFGLSLCKEVGKPLYYAKREAIGAGNILKGLCEIKLEEQVVSVDDEKTIIKRYVPLGVGGAIVPWNFPMILLITKLGPALLTGNTLVCKPSPFTPYTGLKLVELAQSFFPPGVINIVSGDDDLGPWMTDHPDINKISFTGSTATGRKVMEGCSKTLKRVTLELGGKDATIVLPDIPAEKIDLVATQIAKCCFHNASQICMAIKRVFVAEAIAEPFVKSFVNAVSNLKVGPGDQDGTFIGPVQNELQFNRVKGFIQEVVTNAGEGKEGKILLGGAVPTGDEAGFFVQPTVVIGPGERSRIMTEEPFGPILPIAIYSTEEEAIRMANDSEYGLGASVWGADLDRAQNVARQLQAGSVWINEHLVTNPHAPFGGFKNSGVGVEYGTEGLSEWCNFQSLFVRKEFKSLL